MRKTLAVTGCLALLLLSACGSARFYDPFAKIRNAAEQAFAHLAEQPALKVTGETSSLGGEAEQYATIETTVLHDGTAWTNFATENAHQGYILSLPGSSHLRSSASFWEGEGLGPKMGTHLAGEWTRSDTNHWFDPALFTPKPFAQELHRKLLDSAALQITEPQEVTIRGVPAYRVPYGEGDIHVTIESPHRFINILNAAIEMSDTSDPAAPRVRKGTFSIDLADNDDVEALRGMAAEELTVMDGTEEFSFTGDAELELSDDELNCFGSSCTLSITAEIEFAEDEFTQEGILVQSVSVDIADIGTETCGSEQDVNLKDKVEMSCSTDFTDVFNGEYEIKGYYTVDWAGLYEFDSASAAEALDGTVDEILAG